MSVEHSVGDPLIDRYLTRLEAVKGGADHNTCKQYRRSLRQYDEWLGDQDVRDVSTMELERYIIHLRDQDYAEATVKTYFAAVQSFYTAAEKKFDAIEDHPCDGLSVNELEFDERPKNGVHYVTREEKERMTDAVPDHSEVHDRLLIETLWQTGIRKGELRHIRLEDVDQEARQIEIYGEKTNEMRTVHYQPSLNRWLDLWCDVERPLMWDSEYLFPSEKAEQISKKKITRVVKRAAEDFNEVIGETQDGRKLWRITPHALRHGHAVNALKSGIDIRSVQLQLGHSKIETTMRYLPLLDDDVSDAYEAFE